MINILDLRKGDCLELMKNIPDKSVDMILCDLPYGQTANRWDEIIDADKMWEQYKRIIKDHGAIVLFGIEPFSSLLRYSNLKMYRYDWIWGKDRATNFLNARRMPMRKHENISVFYKHLPTYNPQMKDGFKPYTSKHKAGEYRANWGKISSKPYVHKGTNQRFPDTLLDFKVVQHNVHPTQKPVALLEYLIRTYTNEGEIVLDNCMGSGSTGVAALKNKRSFIGYEMDDGYFNEAKKRMERVTAPVKE